MNQKNIIIPASVPKDKHELFLKNYDAITNDKGNLFLFAADHKLEHLNSDFYGEGIPEEVNNPERLFAIAQQGNVGAFATHLGLIARYGNNYKKINYIVKLNGKTNCIPKKEKDPLSSLLWTVEDCVALQQQADMPIRGVGFTIFLGSRFEAEMLTEAAQTVYYAHQHGLVAMLWVYPRGEFVPNERNSHIIAGAAGVANSLGADFVKINQPENKQGKKDPLLLKQAIAAAGNTKVVISGGTFTDTELFLSTIQSQQTQAGTHGVAIGRNIFQHPLDEAIALIKSIKEILE